MTMKEKDKKHFESAQGQDLFALGLLPHGETFLDIGSGGPLICNNTYILEKNQWKGICVDNISDEGLGVEHPNMERSYKEVRESQFFNLDACSEEFINLIKEHYPSKIIDYISLDIDDSGIECLTNLIANGFNFKCMTFEHDLYNRKAMNYINKYASKDLLLERGYYPLFENVCLYGNGVNPWEDWWINLNYLSSFKFLNNRNCSWEHCLRCLVDFWTKNNEKNEKFIEIVSKIK